MEEIAISKVGPGRVELGQNPLVYNELMSS